MNRLQPWQFGIGEPVNFSSGGRPLPLSQLVCGLVSTAGVSFAIGALLAGFYNLFARASARS